MKRQKMSAGRLGANAIMMSGTVATIIAATYQIVRRTRTLCDRRHRPEGAITLPEECRPFYDLMQLAKLAPGH